MEKKQSKLNKSINCAHEVEFTDPIDGKVNIRETFEFEDLPIDALPMLSEFLRYFSRFLKDKGSAAPVDTLLACHAAAFSDVCEAINKETNNK